MYYKIRQYVSYYNSRQLGLLQITTMYYYNIIITIIIQYNIIYNTAYNIAWFLQFSTTVITINDS